MVQLVVTLYVRRVCAACVATSCTAGQRELTRGDDDDGRGGLALAGQTIPCVAEVDATLRALKTVNEFRSERKEHPIQARVPRPRASASTPPCPSPSHAAPGPPP